MEARRAIDPQKTMGISILLGTSLEIPATYALYMVGTSNLGTWMAIPAAGLDYLNPNAAISLW